MVEGGIQEQTSRVLANIKAVLAAANTTLDKVVKTTVFLKVCATSDGYCLQEYLQFQDMNDFAKMNEVYGSAFGGHRPARSTVQVARLPFDALVEIECVASLQ